MTTFDKREQAFENKFAKDQQADFVIEARTAKLFGIWAAEQMGLSSNEVQTYAGDVVAANLEEAGFNDILRKVRKDFDAKGLNIADAVMEAQLRKSIEDANK